MFSGGIAQESKGKTGLAYTFPDEGSYKIKLQFQDGLNKIVDTDFTLQIAQGSDSAVKPADSDVVVEITDDGFSPDSVKIPVGTTVTWINKGKALHWPASDIHPTHTIYPGSSIEKCTTQEKDKIFDACKGLNSGETYIFTFTKAGKWGTHDHLYPGLTMAVEVTGDAKVDDNLIARLREFLNAVIEFFTKSSTTVQFPPSASFLRLDYTEQQNVMKDLSKSNPEKAWEYLKDTFTVDGQIRENPHELAHIVGNEIYRQEGFEGISICDPAFAFGCYHGVTEKMLLELGISAVPMVEGSCLSMFPDKVSLAASCIHGTGHGLLTWEGLDVKSALADCDRLSSGYRSYCYDGVFMENVWGIHAGEPSPERWVDEGDLFYPCNDPRINSKHLDGCWANQPSLMYQFLKGDLKKVGEKCLEVENSDNKKICFNALARQIHPLTKGSLESTVNLCGLMPAGWVNYCMTTVTVSDFSVGGRDLPFKICNKIGEAAKEECYMSLFGAMKVYSRTNEEYWQWCENVLESGWKTRCLNTFG